MATDTPRTEAGRELLAALHGMRGLSVPALRTILAIEAEAAAGPQVHINTGAAEDRAMAWSDGYTAGYDEALAELHRMWVAGGERAAFEFLYRHINGGLREVPQGGVSRSTGPVHSVERPAAGPRDEGLREAARNLYSIAVSEHGHDETHSADWPSCLPTHMAMNRYRDALTKVL